MNYLITREDNKLIEKVFICYALSFEISKSIRLFNYFTYHAGRCKKTSDQIKLILKSVIHLSYLAELTKELNNTLNND